MRRFRVTSIRTAGVLAACALAAYAVALVPHALAAQRADQPRPVTPTVLPEVSEFELGNGLRVALVHAPGADRVTMRVAVLGGAVFDPPGASGTAELLSLLLTRGTGARTAAEFTEALRRADATMTARATPDLLVLETDLPAAEWAIGLALTSEAFLRPALSSTELEVVRERLLARVARERRELAPIAARRFQRAAFGEHPYGRTRDAASVARVTRADLAAFHQERVRPAQAALIVVGDLDSAEVHVAAEQGFGAWSGRGTPLPAARPAPQRARAEILLVHQPGSERAELLVGNTTWMPTDTRSFAFALASELLAAPRDGLLARALRGERPVVDDVRIQEVRTRGLGTVAVRASTRRSAADTAVLRVLEQMRRLLASVERDELERQRQAVLTRSASIAAFADRLFEARMLGLAADYAESYPARVAAVTAEQVQAVSRSGFRADAALIVVVGDATTLREPLERIAPVTVVDAEGSMVVTDATPAAAPTHLDTSRIVAHVDSFAVLLQGQPFGYQRAELRRTDGGWEFVETSALGPIIQQATTVTLGPDLMMRRSEQRGRFQGNEMRLRVSYVDGLAAGEGVAPGAGQMRPVRYADVMVPMGTIEDNVLVGMLPFFDWAADARFDLSVFSSGRGVVEPRSLRVMGREALTVPAGTFDAWRVAYEGGEAPGVYWIEVAAPHRVLKFGPASVPLEFVRVQ